jgi:hypothetical protein
MASSLHHESISRSAGPLLSPWATAIIAIAI